MQEHMKVDVLVVGFGKAGKTIAMKRAKAGDSVVLVEKSAKMYGGTCINIGCVPTKTLLHQVRSLAEAQKLVGEKLDADEVWAKAQNVRNTLIEKMNAANLKMVQDTGVTVVDGEAKFVDSKTVVVNGKKISGETVIINTGATAVKLPIPGGDLDTVVDSTQIQFVEDRPKELAIIGSGPIGLEFASLFAATGTKVTIIDAANEFLPRVDQKVAEAVKKHLEDAGVKFRFGVKVQKFSKVAEKTVVTYLENDVEKETPADLILVAVGRKPATAALDLENVGIETTARGAVQVDDHIRTNVEGVYAAGDVAGSPQFTYVSFDDHRIILADRWADGGRVTDDRVIPTTTFIEPPLATVGKTPEELEQQGVEFTVKEAKIADIAVMPRPKIVGEPEGMARIIVDKEGQILGATLWCIDAQELINTVALAIKHKIPASALGQGIYTHPSSYELFNGILG